MPKSPLSYGSRLVIQDALLLITILFLGAALFWGYWFFFYHDPYRDAQTCVNLLCDCSSQKSKRKVGKYKEFLLSFDSYHFKKQRQARDTLEQLLGADDDLQPCATAADSKRLMLRAYYVATPEKQYQFDQAYNQLQGACPDKYGPELNDLQTETEKKISLLTDPMPREEEIKKDLIGKTIPYWRFAYLSEFKQFHIDSISSGDNSREYWIGMVLQDGRTGISQSDKILMTYLKQNETWYLNDVRALWMRYTTHAPVNDWLPVTPLANCTYGIDTHGLRAWVRDGLYGEQQMVGPDVTTPIIINSNEVYIMSREDQPIDIDFIYYPKQ